MLEVQNLEVVYHSVALVVKGVSLEVPEGGIVALLGPNGAGKTTILRAISGLLPIHDGAITKGEIRYRKTEIRKLAPEVIVAHGIAQVMEGRRILAELTVDENLRAGGFRSRQLQEDLDRAYSRFPALATRRNQHAGYLSGGEQQMLAIARALMSRPRLLLFDEPSLGLAPKLVAEVADLIREVSETGVSVLLVEQNARVALELADYGYVLENGKVVLDGSSQALRDNEDIREFYLGLGTHGRRSYRDTKLYRRRKRWLS